MIKDFRYAMVWGTSVKFNPQKVGKEHQLLDEDVVQIIKKLWSMSPINLKFLISNKNSKALSYANQKILVRTWYCLCVLAYRLLKLFLLAKHFSQKKKL